MFHFQDRSSEPEEAAAQQPEQLKDDDPLKTKPAPAEVVKRPRGRPRKQPKVEPQQEKAISSSEDDVEAITSEDEVKPEKKPRGRGRPKKRNPIGNLFIKK